MADDGYEQKFANLQQYVPFLNNMIEQLKEQKNREQQLAKMESLLAMITDKKKKLKVDTLNKCEDVILKLYEKVKNPVTTIKKPTPITPASPSPPRDITVASKPIVIPTEKIKSKEPHTKSLPKIDIYSSAGDSLVKKSTKSVFDRLGDKPKTDLLDPVITSKDLEELQSNSEALCNPENMSLGELNDLRKKLQKQLSVTKTTSDQTINTTVRNTTIFTKKSFPISKDTFQSDKTQDADDKKDTNSSKTKIKSSKIEKVLKEPTSIFGNLLSDIDNKLLETKPVKDKKDERRLSTGSERRSSTSKDEKKEKKSKDDNLKKSPTKTSKNDTKSDLEKSTSKDNPDKLRTDLKENEKPKSAMSKPECSNDHPINKPKDAEKSKDEPKSGTKDIKIESSTSSSTSTIKSDPKEHHSKHKRSHKHKSRHHSLDGLDEHKTRHHHSKDSKNNKDGRFKRLEHHSTTTKDPRYDRIKDRLKEEDVKVKKEPQIYERLADKYNPKPRKTAMNEPFGDAETKSIKLLPPPIRSPSPPMVPILPTTPTIIPTNAANDFVYAEPQSVLPINEILSDPNTSEVINNVVNQLKNASGNTQLMIPPPNNYGNFPRDITLSQRVPFTSNVYNATSTGFNPMHQHPGPVHTNPQQFYPNNIYPQMMPPNPGPTALPSRRPFGAAPLDQPMVSPNPFPSLHSPNANYPVNAPIPTQSVGWSRDPRMMRERPEPPQWAKPIPDPNNCRSYQEYREAKERQKQNLKEQEKAKDIAKDPRLNRTNLANKQLFGEKDWNTNVGKSSKEDTFISPLDSLYNINEREQRTGKGYGVQKFQIKKTDVKKLAPKEANDDNWDNIPKKMNEPMDEWDDKTAQSTDNWNVDSVEINEKNWDVDENWDANPPKETTNVDWTEDIKLPEVTSTVADDKIENVSEKNDEVSSINNDEQVVTPSKNDDKESGSAGPGSGSASSSAEKNTITEFLSNVLTNKKANHKKLSTMLSFLSTLSDMSESQLKVITKLFQCTGNDSSDDEDEDKDSKKSMKNPPKTMTKPSIESQSNDESDENVVVTVGERIKNRKRTMRRSELDFLHEDIQDMFIRDGVLTATGKRICTALKNDQMLEDEKKGKRGKQTDKTEPKMTTDKMKSMRNVRVMLSKLDDEQSKRYSLRSSRTPTIPETSASEAEPEVDAEPERTPPQSRASTPHTDASPSTPKSRTTGRKRGKTWASGILPKSKRARKTKPIEKLVDPVNPHDKQYYCETFKKKFPCKLCKTSCTFITNHYLSEHSDSEVLCSRLSIEKSDRAIAQSLELHLEDKDDVILPNSTIRLRYRCRFCGVSLLTRATCFYDHVSAHTGEYRHVCEICGIRTSNIKGMRRHYLQKHKSHKYKMGKYTPKRNWYGYICGECNYVQMDKSAVEKHFENYHSDITKNIFKIDMSTLTEDVDAVVVAETPTNADVASDVDDVPLAKRFKLDSEEIDLKCELQNDAELDEAEMDEDKDDKIGVKEKSVALNVFTCATDQEEEDRKIEAERLKTMEEVNEALVPRRQSLSIAEQLSNRLSMQHETNIKKEVISIKLEKEDVEDGMAIKKEPDIDETITTPSIELKKLPVYDKSTKLIRDNSSATTVKEVTPKSNVIINGTIEKLRGILDNIKRESPENTNNDEPDEPDSAEPAPDSTEQSGTIFKEPKPVELKLSNEIDIIRREPPPLQPIRQYQEKTSAGEEIHTMNAGFMMLRKEGAANIHFICRITSCGYTTDNQNMFLEHWTNDHVTINDKHKMTKCLLCDQDVEVQHADEMLLYRFFQHILDAHLSVLKRGALRMRRLSGDQLSAENNPFPFKIVDVKSLASDMVDVKSEIPPLAPISPKWDVGDLIEVPLTKDEKLNKHKSDEALSHFVATPDHLFKCPAFDCRFTTDQRNAFDAHLLTHSFNANYHVVCVYCETKTSIKHHSLHVILQHSGCLYGCSKCLFRSICREYTFVHVANQHANLNVKIITLKPYKFIVPPRQMLKLNLAEVCPPFICGCDGCGLKYFYEDDYEMHMNSIHKSTVTCGFVDCNFKCIMPNSMLIHWRDHNIYPLHCLFCKYGCINVYMMVEHFMMEHPEQMPEVVNRMKNAEGKLLSYEDALDNYSNRDVSILKTFNAQKHAAPKTSDQQRVSGNKPGDFSENGNVSALSGDDSDSQDACGRKYNLIGLDLFRCAYCDGAYSNSASFKAHINYSKTCRDPTPGCIKPFICFHCRRAYKNSQGLFDHIHSHGQMRFNCSLCIRKFSYSLPLRIHMKTSHNVQNTILIPVDPSKTDPDLDEFVLRPRPVGVEEVHNIKDTTGTEKFSLIKTMFAPNEIDELPKRHIFDTELKCALCFYATKVRTNLIRHFTFHKEEKAVPDIAPVNPVPCLTKKEKMFDKMTNLAISSIVGASSDKKLELKVEEKLPQYIPSNRRYVCCSSSCNYLCLEESNLRHHLFALHEDEKNVICPHCEIDLTPTDADGFLKHLKLHDLHLYKCSHCPFIHHLKHKVEKHSRETHTDHIKSIITVRAMDTESHDDNEMKSDDKIIPDLNEIPIRNKPWHCGMCKYKCAIKDEIANHVLNKHNIDAQYKCTLCKYKSNDDKTFDEHFDQMHPTYQRDYIHVYRKCDLELAKTDNFDTTPLWQRDRPRVRHIRGILFEESANVAGKSGLTSKKSAITTATPSVAAPTPPKMVNIDQVIESVVRGSANKPTNDTSIIVIDDEDDMKDMLSTDESDANLVIDEDFGDGDAIFERKRMPELNPLSHDNAELLEKSCKEMWTEQSLKMKYGTFISAQNRMFRCPICIAYRTKKLMPFLEHLLMELGYYRYRCTICDSQHFTYYAIKTHIQQQHQNVIEHIIDELPKFPAKEYWLQLLIKYQTGQIYEYVTESFMSDERSAICRLPCNYCSKWYRNGYELKDHELLHWSTISFSCPLCDRVRYKSFDDTYKHVFLEHPEYEDRLNVEGPYIMDLCGKLDASTPAQIVNVGLNPSKGKISDTNQDEHSYGCMYCKKISDNLETIMLHWVSVHRDDHPVFSYNFIKKNLTNQITLYCCTHCHEKDTQDQLKVHHAAKHPDQEFSIYQLICLECAATFRILKDFKSHFTQAHPGKRVNYSCIENMKAPSSTAANRTHLKNYVCSKCPFRSCTTSGIRAHVRKHIKPVICLICQSSFCHRSEARAHHNKDHFHQPENIEDNAERLKQYEEMVATILNLTKSNQLDDGQNKNVARKSTCQPSTSKPILEPYSFYGCQTQELDLKKLVTHIEINGIKGVISLDKFGEIFDISPKLVINDCMEVIT